MDEPCCYYKAYPLSSRKPVYVPCDAGTPFMSEDGMVVEVIPWGWDEPVTVPCNQTIHEPHAPPSARVIARPEQYDERPTSYLLDRGGEGTNLYLAVRRWAYRRRKYGLRDPRTASARVDVFTVVDRMQDPSRHAESTREGEEGEWGEREMRFVFSEPPEFASVVDQGNRWEPPESRWSQREDGYWELRVSMARSEADEPAREGEARDD